MNDQVRVKIDRDFRPHAELMHASWVHLQHYEDGVEGCYYSLLSSLLLSAFALEAYFNYVGPILEPGWKDFDRAGIWIKLRHVCALSKLPVDTSQGDFQVIKALFDFRNDIAHARPEQIRREYDDHVDHYRQKLMNDPKPTEYDFITEENGRKSYKAVRVVIDAIHSRIPNSGDGPWINMWGYEAGLKNGLPAVGNG